MTTTLLIKTTITIIIRLLYTMTTTATKVINTGTIITTRTSIITMKITKKRK